MISESLLLLTIFIRIYSFIHPSSSSWGMEGGQHTPSVLHCPQGDNMFHHLWEKLCQQLLYEHCTDVNHPLGRKLKSSTSCLLSPVEGRPTVISIAAVIIWWGSPTASHSETFFSFKCIILIWMSPNIAVKLRAFLWHFLCGVSCPSLKENLQYYRAFKFMYKSKNVFFKKGKILWSRI